MEKYNLTQTGQEVQDILDNATPQSDLTAEVERAQEAERLLGEGIQQNADDIDAIEGKIPSAATSENKLATESYVNDAVATSSATFRGTFNLVSDLSLTVDATEQQIATALAGAISTADNNDYAFVQIPTSDETPTEIAEIDRYKFNGTAWSFEYKMNNSGFTEAQWEAINSGITSELVTKLGNLPTAAALAEALASKQNVLTFDSVPTEGSNNPVKSGGVYSAIDEEKGARLNSDAALQQSIEAILLLIPTAASSLNQLADKAFVNSSISTATATFRGTFNLVNDLHLTLAATHAQIGNALALAILESDNNDYAFVQIPTVETAPNEIAQTDRYKFNGSTWEYEYTLNNSGFTSAQWAAINSGITEALVTKLSDLPTNAELTTALGVLTSSITTINQKIPSAASQANQLVDTAAMESYIVQVLDVLTASFSVTSSDGHVTVQISQVDGKITSFALTTLDIASAASLSLVEGRVTTAEGNISTNSADIAILQDAYAALTQSELVVVQSTDTWPVASPATSTIYRVVDRVNTPPQYYSDYMWNGTAMVLMATYDNAIDDVPTSGSNNLVKSGGVFNELALGAIYDVSAKNPTAGPNNDGKWESLSALLSDANLNTLIPTSVRKGGMSIKFVQSSDHKYVQYRLMANAFTTDTTQWQGVDDEPTAGSDNLVTSGGVYKSISLYKTNDGYINRSNGTWVLTSGSHAIFDVAGRENVVIDANASSGAEYTFLKTYDTNANPDYAGDYSTVVRIYNGTLTPIEIPQDARYLLVNIVSDDYRFPNSIILDGTLELITNEVGTLILNAINKISVINSEIANIAQFKYVGATSNPKDSLLTPGLYSVAKNPSNVPSDYRTDINGWLLIANKSFRLLFNQVQKHFWADFCGGIEDWSNMNYDANNFASMMTSSVVNLIYTAVDSGALTLSDTPQAAVETYTKCLLGPTGLLVPYDNVLWNVKKYNVTPGTAYHVVASKQYNNLVFAFYDAAGNMLQGTGDGTSAVQIFDGPAIAPPSASYVYVAEKTDVRECSLSSSTLEQGVERLKWAGKKWVVIGDSLTEVNTRTTKHYFDYIAEKTGISVVNMGLSGSGYRKKFDTNQAFYQRAANVPTDADVITIFGSFNDMSVVDYVVGEPTDTGTDTICGCVNNTLNSILNVYLMAGKIPTIGVITPTPWVGRIPIDPTSSGAIYCDAIIACCKRLSIPVLDLFRESNLHPDNETFRTLAYSKDEGNGVHPDETGHKIIAPMFENFLEGLLLD